MVQGLIYMLYIQYVRCNLHTGTRAYICAGLPYHVGMQVHWA